MILENFPKPFGACLREAGASLRRRQAQSLRLWQELRAIQPGPLAVPPSGASASPRPNRPSLAQSLRDSRLKAGEILRGRILSPDGALGPSGRNRNISPEAPLSEADTKRDLILLDSCQTTLLFSQLMTRLEKITSYFLDHGSVCPPNVPGRREDSALCEGD